jgi:4-amino-4-deoxy-L-arabinose transferase-like glycosyltransferase
MLLDPKLGTSRQDLVPEETAPELAKTRIRSTSILAILPWLIAVFFVGWSLRMVGANNLVDTDAARHAMNGAFIRDAIATGNLHRIVDYGREYYSRMPALSMPYHPPMVPVLEALMYSLLGVNLFAARLLVAVSVGASVVLFYRLIVRTLHSHFLATLSVLTLCFWPISQTVGGDVMLEFPSMAFLLAALHCWITEPSRRPWIPAFGYAFLAAASLWSKQHALLLIGVPFAWVVILRKWNELLRPRLWLATIPFGVSAFVLSLLSAPFKHTGVDQLIVDTEGAGWLQEVVLHNLQFYIGGFSATLPVLGQILVALAFVAILLVVARGIQSLALHVAWAICATVLLLNLGPYDFRYLFYVYPPLVVIGYASLLWASNRVLPSRLAWIPAGLFAASILSAGLQTKLPYLTGPSEAAATVAAAHANRVLYCGSTDGNFIFSVRANDPSLKSVVVIGERVLKASEYSAAELQKISETTGTEYIVVEHTQRKQPCNALNPGSIPSMKLEKRIQMTSSLPRFNGGTLDVYHYTGPVSSKKDEPLKMDVPKIGTSVEVKF